MYKGKREIKGQLDVTYGDIYFAVKLIMSTANKEYSGFKIGRFKGNVTSNEMLEIINNHRELIDEIVKDNIS